jgi:hypothetical protein
MKQLGAIKEIKLLIHIQIADEFELGKVLGFI